MRPVDLVPILEATYAVERPEREWLAALVAAMRPAIEDGLGMAAYLYDASVRPLAVREPVLDGPLGRAELGALMGGSDESYVRGAWLAKAAATASETPGFAEHPGVASIFHPVGIRDVMVLNALDPVGIGCFVGAPLRSLQAMDEDARARWEKVAAHLRAALRLRLRLGTSAEPAAQESTGAVEAVFDRGGTLRHLEPAAEGSRDALHDAVVHLDRARRTRKRPAETLSSWPTLVRSRWTLVDDFEAGNSRYVVARANAASTRGPDVLSARERQVVGLLALGHSLKVIAYELGLSHSTVRVLVGRARTKLGARDRADLVTKLREH